MTNDVYRGDRQYYVRFIETFIFFLLSKLNSTEAQYFTLAVVTVMLADA